MVRPSNSTLCSFIISNSSRSINFLQWWRCSSGNNSVMKIILRWRITNWTATLFRGICINGSHLGRLPFLFSLQGCFWRNLLHIVRWWFLRFYIYWWWKCNIRLNVWFILNAVPLKNYVVIIIDFACIRIIRRYWL